MAQELKAPDIQTWQLESEPGTHSGRTEPTPKAILWPPEVWCAVYTPVHAHIK